MQKNRFKKFSIILILTAVIGAACSIPFYFESPSLYYKTGMDKFMLRSGKIVGIIAALLMFLQLVLIGRFSALEKIWGLKKLFHYHRINGLLVLTLALIHPALILGADHFVFFPFESKYWPEFMGVFLLAIIVLFVSGSHFQKELGMDYKTWRILHKMIAPVILFILFVHVFNVSQTFESGLPFYALGTLAVMEFILIIQKFLK